MATNIETLQTQKAQEAARSVREQAVRRCLAVLAPDNGDTLRAYTVLLDRLQAVISQELATVQTPASDGKEDTLARRVRSVDTSNEALEK